MTVLSLIAPIFGLILIGWVAALAGFLSEKVSDGLSEYVFAIAVPALIIATLTRPGLTGEVTWAYWFSYFGGAGLSWLVGSLIGLRREGVGRTGAILHGFAASQSNTIFIGVPMILQAYGDEGAFPLFMLLAVHLPLMMGCATFLIESDGQQSILKRLKGLVLVLFRNPIFLSLMIGLGLKSFGLAPGGMVKSLVDALGRHCLHLRADRARRRPRALPGAARPARRHGGDDPEARPASAGGLGAGLPRLHHAARLCRGRHPVRGDARGHQLLPAGRPATRPRPG